MFGCLISLRMSISRVTLCTSASSVIFRFSKIFTATYHSKYMFTNHEVSILFELTYLFASNIMSAELHFAECSLAYIFTDNVVTNWSSSWRRRYAFLIPSCSWSCLFTFCSNVCFLSIICSLFGFITLFRARLFRDTIILILLICLSHNLFNLFLFLSRL